jgi:DNA polymerase (family 10)
VSRTNGEIARVLQELAELTKLDEGSPQAFRVRAYEKAAGAVRDASSSVADMTDAEMTALDGVGKSTAAKIRQIVETGTLDAVERLREKYPADLVALTRIPGLGPKTVILLRERLGVENVDDLERALAAEQVRDLPGMGAKSEEKIARAVERLGLHGKNRRTPIIRVLPVAEDLVRTLSAMEGSGEVLCCGSLRRFRDTIGDVDIVVASDDPQPIMDTFVGLPMVDEVIGHGSTKSSILTRDGLQVDLRVVSPEQFGAATLYFTGSKEHNIELRQRAIAEDWTLNEYALADAETDEVVAAATEHAIYEALGLSYIPPEMREGSGEVARSAAGTLPDLVTVAAIRGDLHLHSTWSGDGRSSLDDMVAAAADRGLDYIAMTEHAENLAINGLSREAVQRERVEIDRLRSAHPDLTILHGSELNIGPDGSLDYDEEFLLEFDWCVASVHSHFDLTPEQQTSRVIAAMRHPAVNVVGHLTGRKIGRRPGIELDFEAVVEAALETGTALEVNSHLDRLDVPSGLLRTVRDVSDLVFVISTDSHHVREFGNIEWGVRNARRGWVDSARVANTWPSSTFLEWSRSKR